MKREHINNINQLRYNPKELLSISYMIDEYTRNANIAKLSKAEQSLFMEYMLALMMANPDIKIVIGE